MEITTNVVVLWGNFVIESLDNNGKMIKKIFNDFRVKELEAIILVDSIQSFNARAYTAGLAYNPNNLIVMPNFSADNKNNENILKVALKLIPGSIRENVKFEDITFVSNNGKDCADAKELGIKFIILDSKLKQKVIQ